VRLPKAVKDQPAARARPGPEISLCCRLGSDQSPVVTGWISL
jgi:hypothetical protein